MQKCQRASDGERPEREAVGLSPEKSYFELGQRKPSSTYQGQHHARTRSSSRHADPAHRRCRDGDAGKPTPSPVVTRAASNNNVTDQPWCHRYG
ncbi:unnamed protein product [Ectocarpus sp. 12 AP-2014]